MSKRLKKWTLIEWLVAISRASVLALIFGSVSCSHLDGSRIKYPHGTYVKVLDGYRGVVIESHPKGAKVFYEDYYYEPHIRWFRNEDIFHAEQP